MKKKLQYTVLVWDFKSRVNLQNKKNNNSKNRFYIKRRVKAISEQIFKTVPYKGLGFALQISPFLMDIRVGLALPDSQRILALWTLPGKHTTQSLNNHQI